MPAVLGRCGGGSSGALSLLGTKTLGAAGSLIIGSSGFMAWPSTVRDLLIIVNGRTNLAALVDGAIVVFDNDTATTYDSQMEQTHGGTTWANTQTVGGTPSNVCVMPAATSLAVQAGTMRLEVFAPNDTNVWTTFLAESALYATGSNPWWTKGVGAYHHVGIRTSLEIRSNAAGPNYWATGTRIDVYGRGTQ